MRVFHDVGEITAAVGTVLGTSDWLVVEQDGIDGFAGATGSSDGYFVLSLLPSFMTQVYRIDGPGMTLNYGLNRVRFVTPVQPGARLRGVTELAQATPVGGSAVQLVFWTTVEIEGENRPACVAETVARRLFE
jgi:acyl dehydratase